MVQMVNDGWIESKRLANFRSQTKTKHEKICLWEMKTREKDQKPTKLGSERQQQS